MKFDKIIMNPPYCKNLHLKVLAEVVEHLTDDGKCVNLSPIRWLQDPLAKYKKNSDYNRFEDSVCKHIEDIEMITANDSERIFNIRFPFDLGIYFISRKMAFISYTLLNKNILSIISKVMKYSKQIGDHIEKNKVDGFRVRINAIGGGAHPNDNGKLDQKNILHNTNSWVFENGYQNGIYWTEVTGTKNQYSKKIGDPFPTSINFSTLNSANNFEKCTKTDFMHFLNVICKLDMHFVDALPWLGDAINPRTGKKGYESEWTNEDFYKFFNITEDEQRLIEETMKKYK